MFLFRRLLPAEYIVLLFLLIGTGLYHWVEIPLRVPWYLYRKKVAFAATTYLLGLLVSVFIIRLDDIKNWRANGIKRSWTETLQRFNRDWFSLEKILHDARLLHAVGVMFAVYINLKHLIPFVNSVLYDEILASFETAVFWGTHPTELAISLIGIASAPVVSLCYTIFYPYLAILTVLLIIQRDRKLANRFTASFVTLWFSAIFVEYLIPTLGPCFSTPELIAKLPYTEVTRLQEELWRQKLFIDQHPKSPFGVYLISGLPSLHFAVVLQGSIFLRKLHWSLAAVSWLILMLTFVSTIYFGWHFVVDLLAAAALVFLIQVVQNNLFLSLEGDSAPARVT